MSSRELMKSTARLEPGRTAGETIEIHESLDLKDVHFSITQLKLAAKLGEMNFLYRACVGEEASKSCIC